MLLAWFQDSGIALNGGLSWQAVFVLVAGIVAVGGIINRVQMHGTYHKDHYNHAKDEDKHWTKREREDLRADVHELLKRSGGPRQ